MVQQPSLFRSETTRLSQDQRTRLAAWKQSVGVIVMTFWYVYRNGLNFFELSKLHFYLGLITTPHVLHVHMTYVYSFSHVSFFTRSHGQEKSLLYYDLLYNFGVLFYGHIPTLIFFHLLHDSTPILTVHVDQRRPNLKKDTPWPRRMIQRKIPHVSRRTFFAPD